MRVEALDFEKNFIPRDQSFLKQLDKMLGETKVTNILEQHPTRRDSQQVEDAKAGLRTAIISLEEEQDELSRAGPYTTPEVKETQRLGLRYLESLTTYLHIMVECLEKGKNWTAKDEERMLQQKKEMNSALEEWQALVRRNRRR